MIEALIIDFRAVWDDYRDEVRVDLWVCVDLCGVYVWVCVWVCVWSTAHSLRCLIIIRHCLII